MKKIQVKIGRRWYLADSITNKQVIFYNATVGLYGEDLDKITDIRLVDESECPNCGDGKIPSVDRWGKGGDKVIVNESICPVCGRNLDESECEVTEESLNKMVEEIPTHCDHKVNTDSRCSQCNSDIGEAMDKYAGRDDESRRWRMEFLLGLKKIHEDHVRLVNDFFESNNGTND